MLLGIALHAAISFMPGAEGGWAVHDPEQHEAFALILAVIHGFRLPLFFMISGFFTAMLWRRRGLKALIVHRCKRVLLPCLIGVATIIPMINIAGLLAGATAPPTHAKTHKTALGTSRYLEWTTCETVEEAVDSIRGAGFALVGVELADGAVPLHEATFPERTCLAFGHEDRGLSDAVLGACDPVVFIPQLGKVGSLNVATACGIALYEVHRRLW